MTDPLVGGTYTFGHAPVGRPDRLSQGGADLVSGVIYGPAGELTAMNWGDAAWSFRETRSYNVRLQLTRQTAQALVGGNWVTDVDLEYRFSVTIDPMTNRITNPGFSYDANGNLTAMPLMAISYDVASRVTDLLARFDPESEALRTFL